MVVDSVVGVDLMVLYFAGGVVWRVYVVELGVSKNEAEENEEGIRKQQSKSTRRRLLGIYHRV